MTPPGDNLEFHETAVFANRLSAHPDLRAFVMREVKSRPDAGLAVCGALRKLDLKYTGQDFTVVLRRDRQQLSVLGIYQMPQEQQRLDERLEKLREIFCPEASGGGHDQARTRKR